MLSCHRKHNLNYHERAGYVASLLCFCTELGLLRRNDLSQKASSRLPLYPHMFRPSSRLLRHLEPLTRKSHPFTAQSPATYHIGLSYASKNSPPFESPPHPFQYGFANRQSSSGFTPKITSFITDSLSRPAGRGELNEAAIGGWDERISLETRKWGAGEDFFCVVDREWMVGTHLYDCFLIAIGSRLRSVSSRSTATLGDCRRRGWMGRYR